jgi:hypothetical protein
LGDQTYTDVTELKWAAKRTADVWETGCGTFLLSFELGFSNDGQVFCMNCGGWQEDEGYAGECFDQMAWLEGFRKKYLPSGVAF